MSSHSLKAKNEISKDNSHDLIYSMRDSKCSRLGSTMLHCVLQFPVETIGSLTAVRVFQFKSIESIESCLCEYQLLSTWYVFLLNWFDKYFGWE